MRDVTIARTPPHFSLFCALLGAAALSAGCVSPTLGKAYSFYGEPQTSAEDPWYPKIEEWQSRERTELGPEIFAEQPPSGYPFGDLRNKFNDYLRLQRRDQARAFVAWTQAEARRHYRADPETTLAEDPWPTLKQLFDNNGDDCDGLDLIAYGLLREAGFPPEQLYRAIIMRNKDRENHMVTLWFEDPEDPWVIDATGAITLQMKRFSQLPTGWTPIKMFNEQHQFTIERNGHYAVAGE